VAALARTGQKGKIRSNNFSTKREKPRNGKSAHVNASAGVEKGQGKNESQRHSWKKLRKKEIRRAFEGRLGIGEQQCRGRERHKNSLVGTISGKNAWQMISLKFILTQCPKVGRARAPWEGG